MTALLLLFQLNKLYKKITWTRLGKELKFSKANNEMANLISTVDKFAKLAKLLKN